MNNLHDLVMNYRNHYPMQSGNWFGTDGNIKCYMCSKDLQYGEIYYLDDSRDSDFCCVGCTLLSTTLPTVAGIRIEETTKKCDCEWEVVYAQGCQCGGR